MVAAELENGVIVGTLPTVGEGEHFSVLLTKDSPLTPCINQAIGALWADDTLVMMREQWVVSQGNAPALEP